MEDFVGRIFEQNCGDSLKVLEESEFKSKDGHILYRCEFQKYNFIVIALKRNIINGGVNNPRIEEEEFINKIWPQNCGDSLKILKKSWVEREKRWNFDIEFINHPFIKRGIKKTSIILGTVNNPQIEIDNFLSKEWPQNCGDILIVLNKDKELYKCQFLKYKSEVWAYKNQIKNGSVDNPALPWKTKEGIEKYIKENFNKNPTLSELSLKLGIHSTTLGQYIDKFNLKDLISYYPSFSIEETEIVKYLLDKNVNIETSNWSVLDGKEIDIYLPDLKLGIEFNGNYWHSELFKKSNYHQEKSLLAKEKRIFLLHIWEWEWNEKKDLIKSLINSKIGEYIKKIGASKCKVKEISLYQYNEFCNKNHLQGTCSAKVKLGLFYKDELVEIMSFSSPRFSSNYQWEIIRECSKQGYFVIGGKKKLWSYFIKNYNPESVLSYCDFAKFNGISYNQLGFIKIRLNKPGFLWWDKNKNLTYLRTPWKNKEMKEKYLKLYDAGQIVFSWIK